MRFDLPFLVARPTGPAGFANDNDAPGIGSAPKGTAGIALCCETDEGGTAIACLRPVLVDGTLGEPLHVAHDGTDIIAVWRAFGQTLNLPLFALAADGTLDVFSIPSGNVSYARRGGSPLTGRRTRFARRRQAPLKAQKGPPGLSTPRAV